MAGYEREFINISVVPVASRQQWDIGGCVLVAAGLEVVVDVGLGCVFDGVDSTVERFSSTKV